ncbi:unnamed protein product, partial [Closterium sp. Yama58-4]
ATVTNSSVLPVISPTPSPGKDNSSNSNNSSNGSGATGGEGGTPSSFLSALADLTTMIIPPAPPPSSPSTPPAPSSPSSPPSPLSPSAAPPSSQEIDPSAASVAAPSDSSSWPAFPPSLPSLPPLPTLPSLPALPPLPAMPVMPTIPSMPALPALPDAIVPAISWQSIVAAMSTLVHGSTTDIGWQGDDPKLPAVRDRTDQYARTLRQVMQGNHSLPDDLIYLLIPGLFSNLSPLYLLDTREHFSSLGLTCEIAKIDSQAGVEANARVLRDTVTALLAGKADEGEEIYAHGFPSQESGTSGTSGNGNDRQGSSGAAVGDEKSAKRQRGTARVGWTQQQH